ncbi:hypothetical protein FGG08_003314 [Glutinoglossum americanum]|uniref:Uncharacterized protein n=1 Tax=Glutinoglossum americanum TaxID=1670608 RepID=A0A9P8I2U4_9PEZI|nr:hypothetical protein FGG08_003314 [Glutinoglossum americanum]
MYKKLSSAAFSQPQRAAQDVPVPPEIPSQFSFLFQVSPLNPNYNYQIRRADLSGGWLPPNEPRSFTRESGPLYRWTDGVVDCINQNPEMPPNLSAWGGIPYSEASAFIQPETGKMLAVPFDVAIDNLRLSPYEWQTVGFHHFHTDNSSGGSASAAPHTGVRNLSCIDFAGEEPRLAAPGNTEWVDELLPRVYDYQASTPSPPESGGLCGKLTLILSLMAFSCTPQLLDGVLRYSFGRRVYQRHGCPTGRM